jgi:putative salt-induced outer membrane protein YdiY
MNWNACRTALRNATFFALLTGSPVLGQVNVEDQRLSPDSSGFSGTINFSVEIERGNSDLTEIGMSPRFAYRYQKNLWFMLNAYTFVEADGRGVVNEGFSHLRYNFDLSRRVILEVLAQSQFNREQQLERRYLLGSGVRLRFVNTRRAALALGLTAMYEYERLETGQTVSNARNSNYVAARLKINTMVALSNTVYVQPLFDDPADIRVLDDLHLSIAIARWLAMTISVEYQYDSRPPDGVKEYDFSLKNGLTVRF